MTVSFSPSPLTSPMSIPLNSLENCWLFQKVLLSRGWAALMKSGLIDEVNVPFLLLFHSGDDLRLACGLGRRLWRETMISFGAGDVPVVGGGRPENMGFDLLGKIVDLRDHLIHGLRSGRRWSLPICWRRYRPACRRCSGCCRSW